MSKYSSINFKEALHTIKKVACEFEVRLDGLKNNKLYLDAETLKKHKFLKEKYYVYAAFLAAVSSYPILYRVADKETIRSAVFSKAAMVTSSKVLDNINDGLHGLQEATRSQRNYQQALTSGYSYLNFDDGTSLKEVSRMENTANLMASWAYESIGSSYGKNDVFDMFREDVDEYIEGQIASFYQKRDEYVDKIISLPEFLQKISKKSFGKIWVDIDFCFYEKALGKLNSRELMATKLIKRSIDLLFRSLLFYDDATDLTEDIKDNIVNSVAMLGLELKKISLEDLLEKSGTLLKKLEKNNLMEDAIGFGDALYLAGVNCLIRAKKYTCYIDVDALIFCARLLRMFLLRKLILRRKNLKSSRIFLQSLSSFEKLRVTIPSYLQEYHKSVPELDVVEVVEGLKAS